MRDEATDLTPPEGGRTLPGSTRYQHDHRRREQTATPGARDDESRTRGPGRPQAAAPDAANGTGGHALLAVHHGRPGGGGPRRNTGLWELSGARPPATDGPQSQNRCDRGDSGEVRPL